MTNRLTRAMLLIAVCGLTGVASAQKFGVQAQGGDAPPTWLKGLAEDPNSPSMRAFAAKQKEKRAYEKDLKKLRFQHFRAAGKTELRQEGMVKLRDYSDTKYFQSLIEIFGDEANDVNGCLLDIFRESRSHEGDACIAWVAVYGKEPAVREMAGARLEQRRKELGELPQATGMVVYSGLRSNKSHAMAAAANLADQFDMINAIPWMIASQVSGGSAGLGSVDRGEDGDLAWIAVGTQQAFVSDLTPVVGPNAVGYDPQLDVVTSGTVLRINDAIVYEYHYEIHMPLTRLTSRMTGSETRQLGWDAKKWNDWYDHEFPALREQKLADDAKQAAEAAQEPK